jgi:WD40 repeat protein
MARLFVKAIALLFVLTWPGLTVSNGRAADAPAPGNPLRLDAYGDPLPEGALARLGTLRLVHVGQVTSVAVSPDGKLVASGVSQGQRINLGKEIVHQSTIRLWDATTANLSRELTARDAPVSCLHFGPTGGVLFAGCGRYVCAWDVSTGKQLWQQESMSAKLFHDGGHAERILLARGRVISIHSGTVMCPVETPGRSSHFYHAQKAVFVWDSAKGRPLPLPKVLESTLRPKSRIPALFHDIAVSSNGRYAAVLVSEADPPPPSEGRPLTGDKWTYTQHRLNVIDFDTGTVRYTVPDQKREMQCLAFSADGRTLALTASAEIRLIRMENGQKRVLAQDVTGIDHLAFVARDKHLAAKRRSGAILVWDISNGKQITLHTVGEHTFTGAARGGVVGTAFYNTVRLTDSRSGKEKPAFAAHRDAPVVRFARHSKALVITRDRQTAFRWDTRSWRMQEAVVVPVWLSRNYFYQQSSLVDAGAAMESGLYVKEREERLELRDIKTDRLIRPLEGSAGKQAWYAIFSADGNRLYTREVKSFVFYEVGTGRRLSTVRRSDVRWLGFHCPELLSPRGNVFAKNDNHTHIDLYDVASGKLVRSLGPRFRGEATEHRSVLGFQFSPDEKIVLGEVHALNQDEGTERVSVMLWDVGRGEAIHEILLWPEVYVFWRQQLNEPQIHTLALSPDRRLLALTEPGSKTILIVETASGSRRGELTGHEGPITNLAFSHDGRQLASGSRDTTVLIWDLNRPLQPARFKDRLRDEELTAHWQTLAQTDAKKADTAIWGLIYAPRDSLRYLKKLLRPATRPDPRYVQRLLDDLDSKSFKTRSRANAEIESLGDAVLDALEKAVGQPNSLEKQRRLEALLRKAREAARPYGTAERLRQHRALEVLERIGTPEARQLLRDLAAGAPGARLTLEARAVLARK